MARGYHVGQLRLKLIWQLGNLIEQASWYQPQEGNWRAPLGTAVFLCRCLEECGQQGAQTLDVLLYLVSRNVHFSVGGRKEDHSTFLIGMLPIDSQ